MITLILGKNSYQREQALKKLSTDYAQTVKLDGAQLDKPRLLQELGGQSLFSESTLVVVDGLSNNSTLTEDIEQLLEAVGQNNGLALVETSVDKRTKYYKTIKKQAEVVECKPLKTDQAVEFVRKISSKLDCELKSGAAKHLVERVGVDQQLLASEVSKLALSGKPITPALIDELSPPSLEDSIFTLTDALAAGQPGRAIELYRQLRLGGHAPPDIIGVLAWQLEVVAIIATSPNSNQRAVANEGGLHSFVVSKNWQLGSGLSLNAIKRAIDEMLKADIAIKSSGAPDNEIVEDLLIRLSAQLSGS